MILYRDLQDSDGNGRPYQFFTVGGPIETERTLIWWHWIGDWYGNWCSLNTASNFIRKWLLFGHGDWYGHGDGYSVNVPSVRYSHSTYPNGPEAGREAGWGSEFVPLKKREVGSFILLHKISRTACCFGIRIFLKQYNCYESATIWYTDHRYLAQCSKIINNLQEIPLIFCNYAVRSCGTWRKGPGQSPCNVLSISDLELYVTETSMGVCDPVTD